jgi:hypothetical protein
MKPLSIAIKTVHTRASTLAVRTIMNVLFLLSVLCLSLIAMPVKAQGTTNSAGSSLQIQGQVTNSTNGNQGSTDAISTGDTVQWTNYFQSKLDSPFKSVGVMALPAGFKWVNGSVLLPPKVTLRYCTTTTQCGLSGWTTTEPASGTVVTFVEWTVAPLATIKVEPSVGSNVDFSGSGDGYRVITYKDRLFVLNHHAEGALPLKCRLAATGLPCPEFVNGTVQGLSIPMALGEAAGTNTSSVWATQFRSIEHLDLATGDLYTYLASVADPANLGQVKVACVNLNTLKGCMNAVTMGFGNPLWYAPLNRYLPTHAANIMGTVGSKYYAHSTTNQMFCFDTSTKTPCVGNPFNIGSTNGSVTMGYIDNGLIYYIGNGKMRCFDPTTTNANFDCNGWTTRASFDSGHAVYPVANAAGNFIGVCGPNGCLNKNGSVLTMSTAYTNFLADNHFWPVDNASRNWGGADAFVSLYGSRVFHSSNSLSMSGGGEIYSKNYVTCFDFKTDAVCPNFPIDDPVQTPKTYSITPDLVRSNCYWTLGDTGYAKSFDPRDGGPCVGGSAGVPPLELDVQPSANYLCDKSQGSITGWRALRISPTLKWGTNGVTQIKVLVKDGNGVLLPNPTNGFNPTAFFTSGTHTLDISKIPYTSYPRLKFVCVGLSLLHRRRGH